MVKKIPKPKKVKYFDVVSNKNYHDTNVYCENKLCFYYNMYKFTLKDYLKYLIKNKKFKKIFSINIFNKYDNYILNYENEQCGYMIIPKKFKQNGIDFLKEMLFSLYRVKVITT